MFAASKTQLSQRALVTSGLLDCQNRSCNGTLESADRFTRACVEIKDSSTILENINTILTAGR